MRPRIIPLNLPARLEHEIDGNPVTTRLESAIGNCYPGLEVDVRNLDRRFFPGLIFEFVGFDDDDPKAVGRGARLVAVDTSDPGVDGGLQKQLAAVAAALEKAPVYLDALTVKGGNRIDLFDPDSGLPLDWNPVWRIVRMIPLEVVEIQLSDRTPNKSVLYLNAKRREFQNMTGELSEAYRPGEMSQSLCSPWQHDFRDCGCTYWASNHPDVVLPAHPGDQIEIESQGPEAAKAEERILWMRWEQGADVPVRPTSDSAAAFEIDHYEMNDRWRDLAFVLEGRETHVPWSIGVIDRAAPVAADRVPRELRRLAGIEHALALEYLYARYSVRFDDASLDVKSQKQADFIAHELLTIATSEMFHLRWVNELLRQFTAADSPEHEPALDIASEVPFERNGQQQTTRAEPKPHTVFEWPKTEMRPLDVGINGFLAAESASGSVDGQYAKLLARFQEGFPAEPTETGENRGRKECSPELIGLVERIIADGVTHYSRFREIKAILDQAGQCIIRQNLIPLTSREPEYKALVLLYSSIIKALRDAYATGRVDDRDLIDAGRKAMVELDQMAKTLARKGRAVPLLKIALEVVKLVPGHETAVDADSTG